MLTSAPHPRLDGVTLVEGHRYVLKLVEAMMLVGDLLAEVDAGDVTAPLVPDSAALVRELQELRAGALEVEAAYARQAEQDAAQAEMGAAAAQAAADAPAPSQNFVVSDVEAIAASEPTSDESTGDDDAATDPEPSTVEE